MSTPRPTLSDALVRDALGRRADGPHATTDLLDDVLTAVGGTSQGHAWGMALPGKARPLAILAAAALLLAALVGGVLSAGGLLRGDSALHGDPATVIARYAAIHVGWVYVYADGRVVYLPDLKSSSANGAIKYSYNERRLTQAGVDLVLSGALPASAFLYPSRVPAQAWADVEARPYQPSTYAFCYSFSASGEWGSNAEVDPSEVLDRLPTPAQAVLRGKERAFVDPGPSDVVGWLTPPSPPHVPESRECSEVTPDEARAVSDILIDAGWRMVSADWMANPRATWSPIGWVDESLGVFINQRVVLPHGITRDWGG